MQIITTARHLDLDPEVRLFAQQRIEKLGRYVRDIREAHLIVTCEGYRHHAEITLHLKGQAVVSREDATEPRVAIDRAVDRLENQLRRLKERRVDRKRAGRTANGKAATGANGEAGDEAASAEAGGASGSGEE